MALLQPWQSTLNAVLPNQSKAPLLPILGPTNSSNLAPNTSTPNGPAYSAPGIRTINPAANVPATTNTLAAKNVAPPSPSGTNDVRDANGLLVNPAGALFDRNTGKSLTTTGSGVTTGTDTGGNPVDTGTHARTTQEMDAANGGADKMYTYDSSGNRTGSNNGGLMGGLPNAPKFTQNNQEYGQIATDIANRSQKSGEQYDSAMKNYNDINAQLAGSRKNEADAMALNNSNPIPLEFQQGRGRVLQDQYLAQQGALGSQLQGASNVLGAANTQQQTQLNAENNAAGLLKPELGQYGQTYYNPAMGNSGGGAGVSPNDPFYGTMQTYAQSLANGQGSAIPSSITGNPALQAQLLQMAKAINPNFNYNVAQGVGASQQHNAQVGGSAAVDAGNKLYQDANPAFQQLSKVTIPNIEGFGNLLMQGAGGVNPFDVKFADKTLQQFQSQLSSPQQAQFQATFNQLQKSIAELASSSGGQTPTAVSAQADGTLSQYSKLSTIKATLDRIAQEGNQYLKTGGTLSNDALKQAQGGGGSTGGSSSGGYKNGGAF